MSDKPYGRILRGEERDLCGAYEQWSQQPVDQEWNDGSAAEATYSPMQTSLAEPISVTGPGTYRNKAQRTVTFRPTEEQGWWFDRKDLPDSLPIRVSVRNVWTSARNIVLLSGSPHNYMRMVEHIVALKIGLGLDNLMITVDSGDPPLFDRSSLDMVEAMEGVGFVDQGEPAAVFTVKEPISMAGPNGSFLTVLPAEEGSRALTVDCAVDFKTAIGQQRIRFPVNRDSFRHGSFARTNTNLWMMVYCKTVGKVFADVRNLGYTLDNILVAGPNWYLNEPKLLHAGKALEAAWHRATLDLLAAVALIDCGRLAGHLISYKAGHTLDVQMIAALYRNDLLARVT